MEKTYVYLHHLGFDFFLSDKDLTAAERFCQHCGEEDMLIGAYATEEALAIKLAQLFMEGYDLLPCADYDRIKDKYCPPQLRQWEDAQCQCIVRAEDYGCGKNSTSDLI